MNYFSFIYLALFLLLASCKKKEVPAPAASPRTISYHTDGRIVKQSDVQPIALDLDADGTVDFTVFIQLMANAAGDHLYMGVNPIGITNKVKSTPADDNHFLSMGFAVVENTNALIYSSLESNQRWTDDHSTLAIRHINTNNSIWYEGSWSDEAEHFVGIQHMRDNKIYFGWLRLRFDKTNETVTLIDYAYNTTENSSIHAGEQ